jgi:hypothetical protein
MSSNELRGVTEFLLWPLISLGLVLKIRITVQVGVDRKDSEYANVTE